MRRFPDCQIHRMPQRSEEWFEVRKNKMTGTSMGAWLTEAPKVRHTVSQLEALLEKDGADFKKRSKHGELLSMFSDEWKAKNATHTDLFTKARTTALAKLIGGMSSCDVPDQWEVDPDGPPPRNPAMWAIWNGIRLESEAVERFSKDTGLEVEEVGFCEHKSGFYGISPDGLIVGKNEGFEGKCPLPETHARYLLDKKLPDSYREQVHGSMAATGADAWWFQSYSPGSIIEVFRIRVERDEYTERLARGLTDFEEYARTEISKLLEESQIEAPAVEVEEVE